jgi:hypothetical protein
LATSAAAQRERILDWLDAFADDHSVFVSPHAILLCPVAVSAHGHPLPGHCHEGGKGRDEGANSGVGHCDLLSRSVRDWYR